MMVATSPCDDWIPQKQLQNEKQDDGKEKADRGVSVL
jgi:hypothetical protein